MAPPRFALGIISATVSFVLTQPVVADIIRKYFGSGISQALYTIITIIAFLAISFCFYLALQDFFSIVCHRRNHKAGAN